MNTFPALLTAAALCVAPHFTLAQEPAVDAVPAKRPLISTELTGAQVDLLRDTCQTLHFLQGIADASSGKISREQVQDFAGSVSKDVGEEIAALKMISANLGVPLSHDLSNEQREKITALKSMEGKNADGAFLTAVISQRSQQLQSFLQPEASATPEIQAFAMSSVQAIKDELMFIQLLTQDTAAKPDGAAGEKKASAK